MYERELELAINSAILLLLVVVLVMKVAFN